MGSLSSILFFFLLLWSLFVALSLSMSSQSSQMVMNHFSFWLPLKVILYLSFFFKKIEVCTCVCFHTFMRSCMHMCMRMCGGVKGIVHAITCLRRTEEEDDFVGLVLSFHLYIVTGHQAQDARLAWQAIYLLNHPIPSCPKGSQITVTILLSSYFPFSICHFME